MIESGTLILNKSSQVTFPKAVREILGVELGDRLTFRKTSKRNQIIIAREPSFDERMSAIHARHAKILASLPPEERQRRLDLIEKNRGKTASELRDEWDRSSEGQAYYHEKYGAPINQ